MLTGVFDRAIIVEGRIILNSNVALYSGSSTHGNNFRALFNLKWVATNVLTTVRRLKEDGN